MNDSMREVEGRVGYLQQISQFLSQTEPLPDIMEDALNEAALRTDVSRRVICSVFMPPSMQALHKEATGIHRRLGGRFLSEEEERLARILRARLNLIQKFLFKWLRDALHQNIENRHAVSRLENEMYKFEVGANWRMIVFQNLPKQPEYKK